MQQFNSYRIVSIVVDLSMFVTRATLHLSFCPQIISTSNEC